MKSLYSNIPHKEGLKALEKTLQNENVPRIKIETMIDFSKLVFICNHFKFLGQHCLQMLGTAMGTKMAPSYVNIFMCILEQQMLSTYSHKPFIYFCCIDDVSMIWTEGEDSLNTFLEHCNKQNKCIKFKPTETGTTAPFLNVSVTLKMENYTQICTVNPLTNINTYITQGATPDTQNVAYHIASLYAYTVFV